MLTPELKARLDLKNDFIMYASQCLKIRDKSGALKELKLNTAQLYLHNALEQRLKETGKVRAIILKGRQQGCSTYIAARFFWKITHRFGQRAFVIAHEVEATANLFRMSQRYYHNCPTIVRPSITTQNSRELFFNELDSGYKVGTAGNSMTGRSATIQYLHGSEAALWPNASELAAGLMQAVPTADDTEIIIESTAKDIGNWYHNLWTQSIDNDSSFLPIFIPWYWQPEYAACVPPVIKHNGGWDDSEIEYANLYKLSDEQIYWRRLKIRESGDGIISGDLKFKQEYPATPAEAFSVSTDRTLIPHNLVQQARKTVLIKSDQEYGALVFGIDPARFGHDRTAIIRRRGRYAYGLEVYKQQDLMETVGIVYTAYQKEKPAKIFVDIGGLGAGVYDRLRELIGFNSNVVIGVNFGGKALEYRRYANKRSEMWGELLLWLKQTPCCIPDSDSLQKDLCSVEYKTQSNSSLILESKEDLKRRVNFSPDTADALALTFAQPVHLEDTQVQEEFYQRVAPSFWSR